MRQGFVQDLSKSEAGCDLGTWESFHMSPISCQRSASSLSGTSLLPVVKVLLQEAIQGCSDASPPRGNNWRDGQSNSGAVT